MQMTMRSAFDAYEAVRHRLPSVSRTAALQRRKDLSELADEFDVFLLDAFGVLNIGETAIPGTPERIRTLQRAGKQVLVLTNAASYPHAALLAKYQRLGYQFEPEDVISSRHALLSHLENESTRTWGLMAPNALGREDLEAFNTISLGVDPIAYDHAEGFLLLGSADWTTTHQHLLLESLAKCPRPVLVGNPDIVAPREHGFSTEPGCFAHDLADATGIEPEFFGKPFQNIFDLAFERLGKGFERDRIVMVGDSLHTDILGGQAAAIKSALIAGYGFFAGHPVEGPISDSGIEPDFILDRP